MIQKEFDDVVRMARARQDALLATRGADYTRRAADRLVNFKTTATDVGVSPIQVWAVYASKHWNAIMTLVQTGKVESEAIEGRLDDLCNYLYLLEGLLKERPQREDERD